MATLTLALATPSPLATPPESALAATPGFDDKNFQVLGKVFDALASLAAKAPAFSKRDGAHVVAAVAEKLADVKLRGPGAGALTSVCEALGPSFVFAQLRRRADSQKNPKVTSEALLFCAGAVRELAGNVALMAVTEAARELLLQHNVPRASSAHEASVASTVGRALRRLGSQSSTAGERRPLVVDEESGGVV